ncbi:uncharacterized protein [Garra rufa]|uniref:uncharacterized protein n=1 Tax=Garra rufa TaxID=137080 RepID=UPI003CCE9EAE
MGGDSFFLPSSTSLVYVRLRRERRSRFLHCKIMFIKAHLTVLYSETENIVLLSVFLAILNGVSGDVGETKKMSILEGDSVTLHTDLTEIHKVDLVMWMYGAQKSIIAKLNGKNQIVSLYDIDDGKFGDRLQLDNQTGSLTISDIRTKHSGDYQLRIISSETSYKTFILTVNDVFFAGITNKKEGESVTLHSGVKEMQKHNVILWMFGLLSLDTFIAEINITVNKISFSEDERFRDRLRLDDQTGSLTITNSRTTDTGVYQLQITNSKETFYKRYNVFVGMDEIRTKEVTEGDSVTLHTGLTELQQYDLIVWSFGPRGSVITQIPEKTNRKSFREDVKFRDRLQLNSETGDLTIRDVKITQSGDYQLKIHRARKTKSIRFKLILYVDSLQFSEGENVALDTGVSELQRDDQILWSFGSEDNVIAKNDRIPNQTTNDDGRFGDRLQMDDRTGSLSITNTTSTDSGVYHLQISSRNQVLYKKFRVAVWPDTLKVRAGDSVILNTGIDELDEDSKILWTHGDNDTCIAKMNRATNKTSLYRGNDVRFRDRLQLDHQTGSLSIWNISIAHSDVYKLQISSSRRPIKCKRLVVIVDENKVSVMEGDRAELNTDVSELQRDALILWMFGPKESLIAKADMESNSTSTYDGVGGRFRDRLELDRQTGSLSITNATNTDSGLYKLKIICSRETKYKQFRVTVHVNRSRETNGEDADESCLGGKSEDIPLLQICGTSV